jgi:hypothetical protein
MSTTSSCFQAGILALRLRRFRTPLRTPLGFPLLNRPLLSPRNRTDPEDRSNQASLAARGGFQVRLAYLLSSTEKEERRFIQADIVTPVDSAMSLIEMAIGYART